MKRYLFNLAMIKNNGNIEPCGNNKIFDENSFTQHKNKLMFWFNTMDGNTHIVSVEI